MNDNMKSYIVGIALGAALGVLGAKLVETKRKVKNLDARISARKDLMDEMAATPEPTVDQLSDFIRRGSEIDNMPI